MTVSQPPKGLILKGEENIVDYDANYVLVQDQQTGVFHLQGIPAAGMTAPLPLNVPGGSAQNDILIWNKTDADRVYFIDGAGATSVVLKVWDPATPTATPQTLASDLADQAFEDNTGAIVSGTVSEPFAVSPDGKWIAYMTMTKAPGSDPSGGPRDATPPTDGGVREGGASDAGAIPATGWSLFLRQTSATSGELVATNLPATATSYFFTADSKYLLLEEQFAGEAVYRYFGKPLTSTGMMPELVANGGPDAAISTGGNLFVVGGAFAGDGTTGDLLMFPGLAGPGVTIDSAVHDRPVVTADGSTVYYVKGSGALGDLMTAQISAGMLTGSPTKLQTGTVDMLGSVSPDGKWLSFSKSVTYNGAPFFGFGGDSNITSTASGATPLSLGPSLGLDAWAPDSSSYMVEYNVSNTTGISPAAVVSLSGTAPTKNPDFATANYYFWYRNATTLVYDDMASSLGSKSNWFQGPAPSGKPATTIQDGVHISQSTAESQLVLIPPDDSRAAFVIQNQASKDGLYLVDLP